MVVATVNDIQLLEVGVEGRKIKQHHLIYKPGGVPANPLWVRENSVKQNRS